jgi:hypothetical protein
MGAQEQITPEIHLSDRLQRAFDLREHKRALDAESKALGAELDAELLAIQLDLEAQGLKLAAIGGVTVSLSVTEVPTVHDWDAFNEFIVTRNMPGLLQRRVSSPAWKELTDSGIAVPGVSSFEKTTVNLRKT